MKLKNSLFMMSMIFFTVCQMQAGQGTVSCNTQEACSKNASNTCQCYCSDKCGPRDQKPDDTLIWEDQMKRCWCKQRDKDNYHPHQCHVIDGNKGK